MPEQSTTRVVSSGSASSAITGRNRPATRSSSGEVACGWRSRLFGDITTSGLRQGERTCRRSAWKYWAGVVRFTTRQLSSTESSRNRSSRAEECSGPCPSIPWGRSSTRPESRFHFASPDERNWSTITCAAFTKSPNCASQIASASGISSDQPYSNPSAAASERRLSRISTGPWPLRRCESGAYGVPRSLSKSTAWRWLKVPRRVSWPTSRMRVPSHASEPSASASAMPQSSGRAPRTISARASSTFASFGCTRKPCGTCDERLADRAQRLGGDAGRDLRVLRERAAAEALPEAAHRLRLGAGRERRRLVVGLLEPRPVARGHRVDVGGPHDPLAHELLGEDLLQGRLARDRPVHHRLREGGLVPLVVAVAAVGPEVDHHVAVEALAEVDREQHRLRDRLEVLPVHVDDRDLEHPRRAGAVGGRARVVRARS